MAIATFLVFNAGGLEITANDQGHRITPSWVSFTGDERLYIHKTIVFSTRLTICSCSKMEDPDNMKHWPFKVKDKDGKPVNVKYKGEDKVLVRFRRLLRRTELFNS